MGRAGLPGLAAAEGLDAPDIIRAAVNAYREESDSLGKFIAEKCTVHPTDQVKSGVLFNVYRTFCEQAGERWLPNKDLPAEMERRGFQYRRRGDGRLYLGIRLNSAEMPDWQVR